MQSSSHDWEEIMKKETMIRALRDEEFRASLSAAELAELPEHPAGLLEVDDDMLRSVSGGGRSTPAWSCMPPGQICP
jgi:mersacidin/lichenicidin family type 2 lantibiotic